VAGAVVCAIRQKGAKNAFLQTVPKPWAWPPPGRRFVPALFRGRSETVLGSAVARAAEVPVIHKLSKKGRFLGFSQTVPKPCARAGRDRHFGSAVFWDEKKTVLGLRLARTVAVWWTFWEMAKNVLWRAFFSTFRKSLPAPAALAPRPCEVSPISQRWATELGRGFPWVCVAKPCSRRRASGGRSKYARTICPPSPDKVFWAEIDRFSRSGPGGSRAVRPSPMSVSEML